MGLCLSSFGCQKTYDLGRLASVQFNGRLAQVRMLPTDLGEDIEAIPPVCTWAVSIQRKLQEC